MVELSPSSPRPSNLRYCTILQPDCINYHASIAPTFAYWQMPTKALTGQDVGNSPGLSYSRSAVCDISRLRLPSPHLWQVWLVSYVYRHVLNESHIASIFLSTHQIITGPLIYMYACPFFCISFAVVQAPITPYPRTFALT